MNNNQPQILAIREVNQVNPQTGKLEPYMAVQFKSGAHGPFTETFPKAGFDPATINTRLMDFCTKLGQVQGQ
jgi:hypothetical protein